MNLRNRCLEIAVQQLPVSETSVTENGQAESALERARNRKRAASDTRACPIPIAVATEPTPEPPAAPLPVQKRRRTQFIPLVIPRAYCFKLELFSTIRGVKQRVCQTADPIPPGGQLNLEKRRNWMEMHREAFERHMSVDLRIESSQISIRNRLASKMEDIFAWAVDSDDEDGAILQKIESMMALVWSGPLKKSVEVHWVINYTAIAKPMPFVTALSPTPPSSSPPISATPVPSTPAPQQLLPVPMATPAFNEELDRDEPVAHTNLVARVS